MAEFKKMLPRKEYIKIRGANEHNLKGIDVDKYPSLINYLKSKDLYVNEPLTMTEEE